jgi:hypothetical protein
MVTGKSAAPVLAKDRQSATEAFAMVTHNNARAGSGEAQPAFSAQPKPHASFDGRHHAEFDGMGFLVGTSIRKFFSPGPRMNVYDSVVGRRLVVRWVHTFESPS